MAVVLVMNLNKSKYEGLWNKLENDLLVGQDSYPTSLGATTHLLTNWKVDPVPSTRGGGGRGGNDTPRNGGNATTGNGPAVSFAQLPDLVRLPTNDDFSSLAGYNSNRPTLAPPRKPPHTVSLLTSRV